MRTSTKCTIAECAEKIAEAKTERELKEFLDSHENRRVVLALVEARRDEIKGVVRGEDVLKNMREKGKEV